MSKIKLALISTAISLGVGGAFATNSNSFCETQTQYYKFGSFYIPAGTYGSDYYCYGSVGICTYYLSNPFDPNSYTPCRYGYFTWLP